MIEGIPAREAVKVENLWNGYFPYGKNTAKGDTIEYYLQKKKIGIDSGADATVLRVTPSGHGFNGPENCAEFCPKNYYININDTYFAQKLIWRDNCGLNPVYPGFGAQANGTWLYDRANWCPGDIVGRYDHDISAKVKAGDSVNLDINFDSGYSGDYTGYHFQSQLIYYKKPNFKVNASVDEILSPNNIMEYNRFNPICANAKIKIKNNGTDTLKSAKIIFGMNNVYTDTFYFQGKISFLESEEILLPNSKNINYESNNIFVVKIEEPNSVQDENMDDNELKSNYNMVNIVPADFVIELYTNKKPFQNGYLIYDENQNVIAELGGWSPNELYRDTFHLNPGCYQFELFDTEKDGLSFFANASTDGSGGLKFINPTTKKNIKLFNTNFGTSIIYNFIIKDVGSGMLENKNSFYALYPNPAKNTVLIKLLNNSVDTKVSIYSVLGELKYEEILNSGINEKYIDISKLISGVYLVKVQMGSEIKTEKLIINK